MARSPHLKISRPELEAVPGNGVVCGGNAVTGLDCSGFIAAAYAASGLLFSTEQPDNPMQCSTGWIASQANHPETSCLEKVQLNPGTIRPGDLIDLPGNHIIMVDRVGKDPLGVDRCVNDPDRSCKDISAADFDFDYLHSGSLGDMGPARVEAKLSVGAKSTVIMNNLVALAVQACDAKRRGADGGITCSKF